MPVSRGDVLMVVRRCSSRPFVTCKNEAYNIATHLWLAGNCAPRLLSVHWGGSRGRRRRRKGCCKGFRENEQLVERREPTSMQG